MLIDGDPLLLGGEVSGDNGCCCETESKVSPAEYAEGGDWLRRHD
jgi:hypothetical protein